jgi:hypothetical protein
MSVAPSYRAYKWIVSRAVSPQTAQMNAKEMSRNLSSATRFDSRILHDYSMKASMFEDFSIPRSPAMFDSWFRQGIRGCLAFWSGSWWPVTPLTSSHAWRASEKAPGTGHDWPILDCLPYGNLWKINEHHHTSGILDELTTFHSHLELS